MKYFPFKCCCSSDGDDGDDNADGAGGSGKELDKCFPAA